MTAQRPILQVGSESCQVANGGDSGGKEGVRRGERERGGYGEAKRGQFGGIRPSMEGYREEGRGRREGHGSGGTREGQEWKKSVGEGEERVRLGFEEIWGIIEGVLTNGIRNRYEQG